MEMGKQARKQGSARSGVGFWTCDPKMSLGGGITLVCGHKNLDAWKGGWAGAIKGMEDVDWTQAWPGDQIEEGES